MRLRLNQTTLGSVALAATLLCSGAVSAQQPVQTTPETQSPLRDGPYVIWQSRSTAQVLSFCDGEPHSVLHSIDVAKFLPDPCDPSVTVFVNPKPPTPPQSTWPMPERLLAISDIEGNYDAMMGFLRTNGVVDADDHWAWGTGHLLFNGDIVDRGDKVTETLNAIRHLEREATAAGGQVHFVLGNHEAMILAGDIRYIHPKYTTITEHMDLPYEVLFGANTELGRWLRTRNSIVRIGDWMFLHAGYSPNLDALGLQPDAINAKIRATLGPPKWPTERTLSDHPAWHMDGPLWYRGYHEQHVEKFGATSEAQLLAMLQRNAIKHIVVGHTVVDDVSWIDAEQKLLCIDVHWADAVQAEGLLIEGDRVSRVNGTGQRRPIEFTRP